MLESNSAMIQCRSLWWLRHEPRGIHSRSRNVNRYPAVAGWEGYPRTSIVIRSSEERAREPADLADDL